MNKQLRGIIFKCIIVALLILFFIFLGKRLFNSVKYGEGIVGVRKELNNKYNNIACPRENCEGIIANLEEKTIFYDKGISEIATSTNINDTITDVAENYYISLSDNTYYIKDFNKKVIYKTKNDLIKINDNLILENNKNIINNKGKVLYKDLDEISIYYNGNYIVTGKKDKYNILDKEGNILYKNKKIENVMRNEYNDEIAFLIIDQKSKIYSYYNIEDEKLYSEKFTSYYVSGNAYVVNYKNKEYVLKTNGDLKLLSENKELISEKVKVNSDGKNVTVTNSDDKEVINVKNDDYFFLSDNHYVYIKDNNVNFYNISKDKTYNYELDKNESLTYQPFRKTVFVYNEKDKYLKLIDFKGKLIKKIDSEVYPVIKFNYYNKNAYIITMDDSKYGLYIAN